MIRLGKGFFAGIVIGALVALALATVVRVSSRPALTKGIVAKIGDEALKEDELRQKVISDLIPIETDQYVVLSRGVTDWLGAKLLEKEAKSEGVTLEGLYQKELWSQVRVSYQDILDTYAKTRELYGKEPFERVSPVIANQLRAGEYARVKAEYLEKLGKKYNAQVFLKKPEFFVEGAALPTLHAPNVGLPQPAEPLPPPPADLPPPGGAPSVPDSAPSQGPGGAPITLTEFSDFHCPFCKKVNATLGELYKNYPGKIRWVFRHYPLSFHAGSDRTHEASACAHEQGKFWEFHDALFQLPGTPQETDLQDIAKTVGLDLAKFQECFESRRLQKLVQQDVEEANQKGVQGTPTVFVNDQVIGGAYPYEHFVKVVEGILNPGKAPAAPSGPAPLPAAPAPPAVVQFDDLEGKPSLGSPKAPVTLVEFSDFQCPFCKRVGPTLKQLMKNYPGKVRRVWRHYPLSFHIGSDRIHEASQCAQEQGKFWEYHDKIFETQGSPRDDATLTGLAKQLSLNQKKFEKCLASRKYKEFIQKEIARGNQVGVQGTPAVFVNGKLVSGAQPYENFDQIVKQELTKS